MAKFCIKCGKPLEDGKECSCEITKEMDILTQTKTVTRNYFNLFSEITKGLIKVPIDTIKKYGTEKNFKFNTITIFINAFIFGLFLYCLLKESNFEVGHFVMRMEVPFVKTLLFGILLVIVGFIVTISMIYVLIDSVFKTKVSFKAITSLIGTCSIIVTLALFISIIMVFLSIKLTLFILLIASLFYLVYLCQGIMEITKIDKNKLAYVFVSTVCITLFVVVYVIPKILF